MKQTAKGFALSKLRSIITITALLFGLSVVVATQAQAATVLTCTVKPYQGTQISDDWFGGNRASFKVKVGCTEGGRVVVTRQRAYEVTSGVYTKIGEITTYEDTFAPLLTPTPTTHDLKITIPNTLGTEYVLQSVSFRVFDFAHPSGTPWSAWTSTAPILIS